jgi:hypothetical protein
MQGEAPQYHQLAPEGAQPRPPEREGEEQRRGRRNRGGRDRHRGEPRRDEHQQSQASLAEEQQRIHALEQGRLEESRGEESKLERAGGEEPRREEFSPMEPPAFLVKPERREEPVREEIRQAAPVPSPAPRQDQPPRIDPREILQDAGLVMIETDRAKAPVRLEPEEAPHLGRPRRERAKPEEAELQQVETKR